MPVTARSFAKINIGLTIGPTRQDGFHELRTLYQTVALNDVVKVDVVRGTGVEIRCKDPRVPQDESNTCWRVAERVMKALKARGRVAITIDKQLPVQGGLGAASSNAVATLLALERALKTQLGAEDRLRIASEVGSDLPLFLLGGTVLGVGRGEDVYPLLDLPPLPCVLAMPEVGVSTPKAFSDWDARANPALTGNGASAKINVFSRGVYAWLKDPLSGVLTQDGENRAGTLLLDLVRAGIENDFEQVVFPAYPELREVKRGLEREGARYASLSGSGSALYGFFESPQATELAAAKLNQGGTRAVATSTLTREQYWKNLVIG